MAFCLTLTAGCMPAPSMGGSGTSAASAQVAATTVAPAPAAAPAAIPAAAKPAASFTVKEILEAEQPLNPGEYLWDPTGAPDAPLWIVVDVQTRLMFVYRGDTEIGRSYIVYGDDDKPTPLGTFPILEKKKHHVSNLYGAPMPYMQRLTMDGIAVHGSEVGDEWATHGCVGVPDEFAALLFDETRVGDIVKITKNWMSEKYADQI